MRLRLVVGIWSIAVVGQTVCADGLIYQLPPDGTSARYDVQVSYTESNAVEREVGAVFTMSSVGQIAFNNENCQWIEFKSVTEYDQKELVTVVKLLIPEKHLEKGKSPCDHVVRGWVKRPSREPQAITDLSARLPLGLYIDLAGPAPNLSDLEEIEIDTKFGKLACVGVTGDQEFRQGKVRMHFENRFHARAPFGVLRAIRKIENWDNGKLMSRGTTKLILVEANIRAVSELPDKN